MPADHTAVRSHDKEYVIRNALESMYDSNGKLNVNDEDIFSSRVVFWTTGQPEGFKNHEFSFKTRKVPPILFAKTFNDYVVERSMALLRYHTL